MAWDDWFGSLFGSSSPGAVGSSVYGPPGSAAPSALGGLLDPQGIRQQAAWQGLGALSQGLLAAGMQRPAGSPSPLPQALGAFQPAYSGALSQGYQQASAEQQMRQQQQDEQYLQAYRQANPAYANLPRAALIAQISRTPPTGFEPDPTSPGAMRPIVGGPEDLTYRGARTAVERDPVLSTPEGPVLRAAIPGAGGMPAAPPQPGTSPPSTAGGAQPGGAPSGQPATSGDTRVPVGIRNNNWVSMTVPGTGGRQLHQYETPEVGIAAASQNLDRLFPSGTVTPRQLVQMWAQGPNYNAQTAAPNIRASVENYGTAVARAAGVSNPDQPINLQDPATRLRVMQAMGQFETGGLPQGADAVIARGVALAAQPGASFRPAMPRQVAQAGGAPAGTAAPAPAPAPAPAAAAPAIPALIPDRSGATAPVAPPAPPDNADLVLRRQPGAIMQGPTPNQISAAREFNGQFLGQTEVKNALRVTTVLRSMEDAATRGTAASDLNLVYGLMTILDPTSVVREGESVMVRSTQSIPDRLRGAVEQALSGNAALSPEARAAIMTEARTRAGAQIETYNDLHGREARLVRASNLNPDVVLGPRLTMPQQPQAPRAAAPPPPPPPTSAATPAGPARPGAGPGGTGTPAPPAAGAAGRQDALPIPDPRTIEMMSIDQVSRFMPRLGDMTDAQRRAVETVIAREEARRAAGQAGRR